MRRSHLIIYMLAMVFCSQQLVSCIEPPLHLPGEEVLIEVPVVETELNVIWDVDADWSSGWYYGWDEEDDRIWGGIGYNMPTSYQVRSYFTGNNPSAPHTEVDAFSIRGERFRRFFPFGYYDMLFYSDIDSPDGTQVLVIDESLNSVTATTTGTRGLSRAIGRIIGNTVVEDDPGIIGLKNQPEIFYAAYPEDIYISRNLDDYVYDPVEDVYVKHIDATLKPLVYIYLVQVILVNNDGRVKGINGNAAISSLASGVDVYTGHTNNSPTVVYYNTRFKSNKTYKGEPCDIIGGKFTTFGLCDMEPYSRSGAIYTGSRASLKNHLFFDLVFSNNLTKTYSVDVTDQFQTQAHGGIITVVIDCSILDPPEPDDQGTGSLFVPTVEDYDEVYWEIEL